MTVRVNYDQIAERYDSQPFRDKPVDPDLLEFLAEPPERDMEALTILDIGCGTGNQLIANLTQLSLPRMIGLDAFHGMLRQARGKADDILWIQGDGAELPFADASFDFITNQFAFHHVQNKPSMIAEVFRVLRPNGRFVMQNICPREMLDWMYYRYFPKSLEADLEDFMPKEDIRTLMVEAGFDGVDIQLNTREYQQSLPDFLESVKRRDTCSQLITIPDTDYQAGLEKIEAQLHAGEGQAISIPTKICLIKIIGEKKHANCTHL